MEFPALPNSSLRFLTTELDGEPIEVTQSAWGIIGPEVREMTVVYETLPDAPNVDAGGDGHGDEVENVKAPEHEEVDVNSARLEMDVEVNAEEGAGENVEEGDEENDEENYEDNLGIYGDSIMIFKILEESYTRISSRKIAYWQVYAKIGMCSTSFWSFPQAINYEYIAAKLGGAGDDVPALPLVNVRLQFVILPYRLTSTALNQSLPAQHMHQENSWGREANRLRTTSLSGFRMVNRLFAGSFIPTPLLSIFSSCPSGLSIDIVKPTSISSRPLH